MKQKRNTHDGAKLAIALLASLLSVLMVAAFCSSSSKMLTSATVDSTDTDPSSPVTWSPDMFEALFGTTGGASSNEPSEDTDNTADGSTDSTPSNDTNNSATVTTKPSSSSTVTTKPNENRPKLREKR